MGLPIFSCKFSTNKLSISSARSGFSASIKEGRLPFLVEAYNVNWLMTNISPSISRTDLFIFPCSSEKIRRFAILLRSEEHTSELQSRGHLVCRLLLEKKKNRTPH